MNNSNTVPNKLINEKSPYLLQHAYNPVNWWPWCKEAFEVAKNEDKPIFLSIGYSTCHWCHVMERESFENPATAEILNNNFISIKVDKEERPDVDSVYMEVCEILNGNGGWPLSIFLTPDQKPFYAGTYFPDTDKYGMPSFSNLLLHIINLWKNEREKIFNSSESIIEVLLKEEDFKSDVDEKIVDKIFLVFKKIFDPTYGGIKSAPKFPTPQNIYFLLRYYHLTGNKDALTMVEKTLISMYEGGIFDHIGFGFSRYSTDFYWLVPHFEKMLYDNSLLMIAYGETYQVTKKNIYKEIAEKIFTFISREMKDEGGCFYTALDADSEGVEGKYYVWDKKEIINILGEEDGKKFCSIYNIIEEGNFEGKNIPNLIKSGYEKGSDTSSYIEKLFNYRSERIRPHMDDKILTGQNGMMIAALSYCGRVFNKTEYLQYAEKAINFIENNLIDESGRLLAVFRKDMSPIKAYSEDYSYLTWGLIETYHATGNKKYLNLAEKLNTDLIKLFWNNDGVYFTGNDAEKLILRTKKYYDGAYPSSNSVTAMNFIRLSELLGEESLKEKALAICRNLFNDSNHLNKVYLAVAYMFLNCKYQSIKFSGLKNDEFLKVINECYLPFCFIKFDNNDKNSAVYLCNDTACLPPITNANDLLNALNKI